MDSPENYWRRTSAENIPSSCRLPIEMLPDLALTHPSLGLDMGSGSGTNIELLKGMLPCPIFGLDLSLDALKSSKSPGVQAQAEQPPFLPGTFDFITAIGLFTCLACSDHQRSRQLRESVVRAQYDLLRPGGIVIVSDCGNGNLHRDPPYDYNKHAILTGEYGTVAVFGKESPPPFSSLPPEEIPKIGKEYPISRFAHHYSLKEMLDLFGNAGFEVTNLSMEKGKSPSGKSMDALTLRAVKPY